MTPIGFTVYIFWYVIDFLEGAIQWNIKGKQENIIETMKCTQCMVQTKWKNIDFNKKHYLRYVYNVKATDL